MTAQPWMEQQAWMRDTEGPCVSLGEAGAFDDMHLFAPCVALENGVYSLWYCGARGTVTDRVLRVGRGGLRRRHAVWCVRVRERVQPHVRDLGRPLRAVGPEGAGHL